MRQSNVEQPNKNDDLTFIRILCMIYNTISTNTIHCDSTNLNILLIQCNVCQIMPHCFCGRDVRQCFQKHYGSTKVRIIHSCTKFNQALIQRIEKFRCSISSLDFGFILLTHNTYLLLSIYNITFSSIFDYF